MGVPVISLSGPRAVNRSGLSLLASIGLGELVADRVDGYVAIATALANNLDRLDQLSSSMRDRMQQSKLMDCVGFTRGLESIYRAMWVRSWAGVA